MRTLADGRSLFLPRCLRRSCAGITDCLAVRTSPRWQHNLGFGFFVCLNVPPSFRVAGATSAIISQQRIGDPFFPANKKKGRRWLRGWKRRQDWGYRGQKLFLFLFFFFLAFSQALSALAWSVSSQHQEWYNSKNPITRFASLGSAPCGTSKTEFSKVAREDLSEARHERAARLILRDRQWPFPWAPYSHVIILLSQASAQFWVISSFSNQKTSVHGRIWERNKSVSYDSFFTYSLDPSVSDVPYETVEKITAVGLDTLRNAEIKDPSV